jgi:hypothetical protein
MGNQQERSLTWLAAAIECEGSISTQVYTLRDGRVRLTPFVCFVNSDRLLLAEVARILDEIGIKWHSCKHGSKTNLPVSTYRIDGMKPVKKLLEILFPYMIGEKRRNAVNVLSFIKSREERGIQRNESGHIRRAEYSKREIELATEFRTHKKAKSSETICLAPNVIS